MSGFPAAIGLSSLNGTNGFSINGVAAYDGSGWSVSSAGDVNGDGFDDLIIGAPFADVKGSESGAAYVVLGKASGFAANLDLSSLDGTNGFRLRGAEARYTSGWSVSSAGDINGDGFADVIVGAPFADPNGNDSGASYVVFGKASGFTGNLNLAALDGSNGFKLSGEAGGDQAGRSVASAGDVNGDGFDDLIIGTPRADINDTNSGAAYVVFGKAGGFAASINLSSLDGTNGFRLNGAAYSDNSGASVSSAGDVNGDGFADLIIGARGADPYFFYSGTSYVVFGKAAGFDASIDLSALDGTNGFRINGVVPADFSGISVAAAGDINGDGVADLIVGDHAGNPGFSYTGGSYVVFGKASGLAADINVSSLDGTNGFKITGVAARDSTGFSVSSAGDFNGDGFADLIIGSHLSDSSGFDSGAAYVVFGKASGFSANIDLSSLNGSNGFRLDGVAAFNHAGRSVSSAGDVNGDGFDDLVIGAPRAGPYGTNMGATYVVFGQRAQKAVTIEGTALGLTHNGGLGKDKIDGLGGDDTLKGWEGNDRLNGGTGNDIIVGGAGRDLMTGGGGKDVFVFETIADSASAGVLRDVISDFRVAAGTGAAFVDRIDVSAIDASGATGGNQAFTFIGQASFTAEGQIRALQDGLDTRVLFNTSGSGGVEMAITLRNFTASTLTAADFIL